MNGKSFNVMCSFYSNLSHREGSERLWTAWTTPGSGVLYVQCGNHLATVKIALTSVRGTRIKLRASDIVFHRCVCIVKLVPSLTLLRTWTGTLSVSLLATIWFIQSVDPFVLFALHYFR
jgi:hypothetical protein